MRVDAVLIYNDGTDSGWIELGEFDNYNHAGFIGIAQQHMRTMGEEYVHQGGRVTRIHLGEKGCRGCTETPVSHFGMPHCRSHSLASGGTRAHCTCDGCF